MERHQVPENCLYVPEPFYLNRSVESFLNPTTPDLSEAYEAQWQRKTYTPYCFNDFLKLAAYEDINDEACKKVSLFAQRWGPLWRCRGTRHNPRFPHYYISFLGYASFHYREQCCWIPSELVLDFVIEAQRAKGALEAYMKLYKNDYVPESVWRTIYMVDSPEIAASRESLIKRFPDPCYGPSTERNIREYEFWWNWFPEAGTRYGWSLLMELVNHYIAKPGGLTPCLVYDSARQGPQLRMTSQLGFLPAVWSEIAQHISGVHQLYRCDGCREFYHRTGRKPKEGQKNYCIACREAGYKQSKRESKARRSSRVALIP